MTKMDVSYTRLSNDIIDALSKTNLTAYEWRFVMVLFRKTYGRQKKDDWIADSQIVSATGIHKSHVSRTKKLLLLRNIVIQQGNKIGFNKYHGTWKELPNGVTNHSKKLPNGVTKKDDKKVTPRGTLVTPRGILELPHGAATKETLTKESIQKKPLSKTKGRNANVDLIIDTMQECFGTLDDTVARNRQFAWNLIRKAQKNKPGSDESEAAKACASLIRAAQRHVFWGKKLKKVASIYYNVEKIAQDLRLEGTGERSILNANV